MPRLPELKYREVVKLLKDFGCSVKNPKKAQLVGRNRHGKPYSIHLHPKRQSAWPELVAEILKRADVTHDEFWAWYNKGKK